MGKLSRSVSAASVAVVRAALVTGCTTQADFEALRMEVMAAKAAADRDPADGDHGTRRNPAEQGHRGAGAVLEPLAEFMKPG